VRAEAAITLATNLGFPLISATGTVLKGWALAEQGREEEGIARLREGIATWRSTRSEIQRPHFLALLAEAYRKAGQIEEGLTVLVEALALVNRTGECFYEAELYRLKGELLLTQEGYRLQAIGCREKTEEVEKCFLKAIDVACKQQAKSLELRAT